METKKRLVVSLLAVVIIGFTPLFAQNKKEIKEKRIAAVKERVESRNYEIEVNRALPMGAPSITLTYDYSLKIKNDSVYSYLPYYGRAYSIPYGGGKGLNFRAPLKKYEMKIDRKGRINIRFETQNSEDHFKFIINIYDNGSANIDVNMQNRQSISYYGDLNIDKKKN